MIRPSQKSKDPSPRSRTSKDPMEYWPDRPGRGDQPGAGQPGDELRPPPDVVSEQEIAEVAVESGHLPPPVPMPPDDVPLPSEDEAAPERPPNPAWPKERRP